MEITFITKIAYMLNTAIEYIMTYDINDPFTFVLIALAGLVLMRKWRVLFMLTTTVVLGRIVHDLIVLNIRTNQQVISLPLLIYVTGGVILLLVSMVSFTKYSIK